MTKPLVVVIPHQLGRTEAKRRLQTGFGELRTKFRDKLTAVEDCWTGDHLQLSVKALGQAISAAVDVADDQVRIEVQLPWLLAMIAGKARGMIEKEGGRLLIGKR